MNNIIQFTKNQNKIFKEKKDANNIPYIILPELNYYDFRTYFEEAPTFSKLIINEYHKILGTNIIGKTDADEAIIKKYSIREKVDQFVFSCVLNGGGYFQIGWSDVMHTRFTDFKYEQPYYIMVGKPDENDKPVFFYYSTEWYKLKGGDSYNEFGEKKENRQEWRRNTNAKYVPIQNFNTEFSSSPRQIIQFKMTDFFDTYNFMPRYIAGKNNIFFDVENGRYVSNLIGNRFNNDTVVNVPDIGFENQEAKDEYVDDLTAVRGSDSAGGLFVNFYDPNTGSKLEVIPISTSSSNEQYVTLDDKNQEALMRIFQLPNPAIAGFRTAGSLGASSGEDLKISEAIYNRNLIIPSRQKIENFLKEYIFKYLPAFNYTWDNISLVEDNKAVGVINSDSGITADNVAATALNGAQISSLIEIVQSWKDGILSTSSAMQIVKSAFPTFTDEDVQKIFM